jgi:hypothetical protein
MIEVFRGVSQSLQLQFATQVYGPVRNFRYANGLYRNSLSIQVTRMLQEIVTIYEQLLTFIHYRNRRKVFLKKMYDHVHWGVKYC